jgi:hypothetical protein
MRQPFRSLCYVIAALSFVLAATDVGFALAGSPTDVRHDVWLVIFGAAWIGLALRRTPAKL